MGHLIKPLEPFICTLSKLVFYTLVLGNLELDTLIWKKIDMMGDLPWLKYHNLEEVELVHYIYLQFCFLLSKLLYLLIRY